MTKELVQAATGKGHTGDIKPVSLLHRCGLPTHQLVKTRSLRQFFTSTAQQGTISLSIAHQIIHRAIFLRAGRAGNTHTVVSVQYPASRTCVLSTIRTLE